jgi:outer membrane protein TolC
VYAKAVEQANENYRITKNKYDNSLATTDELIDADVAQLQARMNLIFVKADALVLYYELLKTSGSLE